MNNGFKTKIVEPEQRVTVADGGQTEVAQAPNEELAAKALDEIRSTDRLSGFGRFATKVQNFFQASKSQQERQCFSHLKAAPIMMSAGLLLLFATALLFLLSKPDNTVPSHFRPRTSLTGTDHQNTTTNAAGESLVTEDQLAGRDASADGRTASSPSKKRAPETPTAHRFSFADSDRAGGNPPAQSGVQSGTSALAAPATVFVVDSAANPVPKLGMKTQSSPQPEFQLPAGTEIVAHTRNAISSGLESPVVAVVDRSIQFENTTVIPEGARVIGQTAGAVKDRVNVRFTSVVLSNDREMPISGLALMKDGSTGLVGKVKGKRNPVLAGAARVGTGAAVVATEFAGQGSLEQPFSQSDYLRNQMAAEVASQGGQLSNRWQQPFGVPIVAVDADQPITIFLLEPLTALSKAVQTATAASQLPHDVPAAEQKQAPDQALIEAQTAYIQALEAQLAETKAGSRKNPDEHQ